MSRPLAHSWIPSVSAFLPALLLAGLGQSCAGTGERATLEAPAHHVEVGQARKEAEQAPRSAPPPAQAREARQARHPESQDDLIDFLCPKRGEFDPATAARAANTLIRMGEKEAMAWLARTKVPAIDSKEAKGRTLDDHRKLYLIRMLYRAEEGHSMRGPRAGMPMYPYRSMPPDRWPLLPLCESHGVVFLLTSGWLVSGGMPESAAQYLEWCRKRTSMRTEPYPVPSRSRALAAWQSLLSSARWQRIRWKDQGKGWSYSFSVKGLSSFLEKQARRIPK